MTAKKALFLVQTAELGSSIGAAPYFNQFFEAFRKAGMSIDIFTTLEYDKKVPSQSLVSRLNRKYFPNQPAPFAKDVVNKYRGSQKPDYIFLMGKTMYILPNNLQHLRKSFPGAKIVFYDLEAPLNFPEYMTDSRYSGSPWEELRRVGELDFLDECLDWVIIPSKGAVPRTQELLDGFKRILTLYFSVDPSWYPTEPLNKQYDVCFFGKGAIYREESTKNMITIPSVELPELTFIATEDLEFDLGNAKRMPVHFDTYTTVSRQSRINLSITRQPFAKIYASSISRPFELAAMKSCIVSNKCEGLNEFFEPKKELLVVDSAAEAKDAYKWLLGSPASAEEISQRAHDRLLKDHQVQSRVDRLLHDIGS